MSEPVYLRVSGTMARESFLPVLRGRKLKSTDDTRIAEVVCFPDIVV
jgi:hypothetical protein